MYVILLRLIHIQLSGKESKMTPLFSDAKLGKDMFGYSTMKYVFNNWQNSFSYAKLGFH
jgi:hypothetical protein